jgi:RsiW-degrading membrane proteinase PrsW (M82 family)
MWLVLALTPAALYLAVLFPDWRLLPWLRHPSSDAERTRRDKLRTLVAIGLGAAIAVPVELAVRALAILTEVDPKAQITGALMAVLATLFLYAPLEEAAKVVALAPIYLRFVRGKREGALLATAVAMGFTCVELALYLRGKPLRGLDGVMTGVRALLATVARLFAAGVWGYALGRARGRGQLLDRASILMFVAVTLLRGLYDHLVFGRGLAALLGSLPLFGGMMILAYIALREIAPQTVPTWHDPHLPFFPPMPAAPSLHRMREALTRAERPVALRWIVLGAVVTVGVIVTFVVLAVLAGHRLGVDFSLVDEGAITAAQPLMLIGAGVLLAFPVAGYLVTRASRADSVLEPALATGLAIVGILVMLGLAAPVAVIFALAVAPVAFGLACAGAWVGIGSRG